jgi:flagellar hook capping protein FlgD
MNNPRIAYFFSLLLVFWVAFSVIAVYQKEEQSIIEIPSEMSEPNASENPQDRSDYEYAMLADPTTGLIPDNIKFKEQAFTATLRKNRLPLQNTEGSQGTEVLNWRSIGPNNTGGRTRAVAIDVTNEDVILAGGVSGGVWRSEDGGASWIKTTGAADLHSVTTIVQDTRAGKEQIWYYGTGELRGNSARGAGAPYRGEGIYKSINGGRTWQILPSTATNDPASFNYPFNYVWDIVINPNSANDEVIAAIFGGIVKSDDGGFTWDTVLGDDLLALGGLTDLNETIATFYTDIHVTSDGTFYAALSSITSDDRTLSGIAGIYQSNDGDSWVRVKELASTVNGRTELGSSQSNPNLIYVVTDSPIDIAMGKYDALQSLYTDLSENIPALGGKVGDFHAQGGYNLFIAVHPDDDQVVYLGGTNLYRSTDGFSSTDNTDWIGGYDTDNDFSLYPNHHPDQHDVVFYPSNSNRMISVNDGGIYRTSNNLQEEVQYVSLNNGYVTTQFYTAEVSKLEEDNFVIAGTQDNGTMLTATEQDAANRIWNGDGGYVATTKFGIYYYAAFQNAQIYRLTLTSQNQLSSFARVDPIGAGQAPNQGYLFINPYLLDPNNQNRMYLAGGDFVWRNRNLSQIPSGSQLKTGYNWTRMNDTWIPNGSVSALGISSEPSDILYYGSTIGQLMKVENANTDNYTVTYLNALPGVSLPVRANISSISVDPANADNVLLTFSNYSVPSIFFSSNGGTSFSDVSGNLEENLDGSGNGPSVRWGEVIPLEDGTFQYYVGTSTGLYSTTTLNGSLTTWVQEGPSTIGNTVVTMTDYRRSDGRIVAATHGNGLYFSEIPNVIPETEDEIVEELVVLQSYPNPFSDLATIRFELPESDYVVVRIYNMIGQLVTVASAGLGFTGENEIFWDGTDEGGNRVNDGIYLVRFTYREQNATKRVILSR